jgi:hypothetical protein
MACPSSRLAQSHHYDQQYFVQGFHQGTTPQHVSIDFVVQKLFLYRSYPEVMVEQLVRILGKNLCIRKETHLMAYCHRHGSKSKSKPRELNCYSIGPPLAKRAAWC